MRENKNFGCLQKKSALLVTNNNTDRSGWRKILKDAGVDQANIISADSFNTAKEELSKTSFDIVFCVYELANGKNWELFKLHQKIKPIRSEAIFIFIAEVGSQSITAMCGEYEVDGLILKPYNLLDLESSFKAIVKEKMSLGAVGKKIAVLEACNLKKDFEKVKSLASTINPSNNKEKVLLNCALAYAHSQLGQQDEAIGYFKKSLALSPLHHKTLIRFFEYLMTNKMYEYAYEIAHAITSNYPINPEKIPEYIRVSIATKNYETVIDFCESLKEINEFDEMVKKQVGAGLALASKYLLLSRERKVAYKAAKKVISLGIKQTSILATAMNTLIELGQIGPVEKIIESIPSSEMDESLLIIDLKYADKKEHAGVVFKKGMELTSKNIHAEDIYEILIRRAKELKRTSTQIDDLVFEATKYNPSKRRKFEAMK